MKELISHLTFNVQLIHHQFMIIQWSVVTNSQTFPTLFGFWAVGGHLFHICGLHVPFFSF
jgi:hypothetical protein